MPLPFFLHVDSGAAAPAHHGNHGPGRRASIEQGGIEAWSRVTTEDILGAEDAKLYTKSTDILDVWFDSGTTFWHVLRGTHAGMHHDQGPEADLYLEGHDQHRGWFHSSLLLASAIFGRAPVPGPAHPRLHRGRPGQEDEQVAGQRRRRRRRSAARWARKSSACGVASTDYSGDLAIDDKILARVVDAYRRIRNTLRFLLANTSDFDAGHAMPWPYDELLEIDQLRAGARSRSCRPRCWRHYKVYEFHPVVAKLAAVLLGRPGRFLPGRAEGPPLHHARPRAWPAARAQTALHQITHAMLRWMAPFLSFTAEEAWKIVGHSESIFLETFTPLPAGDGGAAGQVGAASAHIRDVVNKDIENRARHRLRGLRRCRPKSRVTAAARRPGPAAVAGRGPEVRLHHLRRAGHGRRRTGHQRRRPANTPSASAAGTTATTWA